MAKNKDKVTGQGMRARGSEGCAGKKELGAGIRQRNQEKEFTEGTTKGEFGQGIADWRHREEFGRGIRGRN